MSNIISLFPTLNDELLDKVKFQASPYEWYYINENRETPLVAETLEGGVLLHKIIDNQGIWTPDEYNLCVRRKYSLKSYHNLFGENGIACKNAVLGLALVWMSADSKQRGAIQIGEIKNSINDLELDLKHSFFKAQLRGSIEFTTIIYIKYIGTPLSNEEHLANECGCVLGELDKFIINLDGTGSVFPIYEVKEEDKPLWYVKCDWDDPTYDKLNECISININTAHKDYKYLDRQKRTFNQVLLQEIMSSALSIIVTKLKEEGDYWDSTINGENLRSGSVSEAIYYFISTLEWDVTTIENLSLSIRKFFDKRM